MMTWKLLIPALNMIQFAMCNTLLTFRGKYYEYGSGMKVEEKGLTIGGYGSAFLADIAAAHIMEMAECAKLFESVLFKDIIYRDDGIMCVKRIWNAKDVEDWLYKFQNVANEALGSERLKFTAELWSPNSIVVPDNPSLSVC